MLPSGPTGNSARVERECGNFADQQSDVGGTRRRTPAGSSSTTVSTPVGSLIATVPAYPPGAPKARPASQVHGPPYRQYLISRCFGQISICIAQDQLLRWRQAWFDRTSR